MFIILILWAKPTAKVSLLSTNIESAFSVNLDELDNLNTYLSLVSEILLTLVLS